MKEKRRTERKIERLRSKIQNKTRIVFGRNSDVHFWNIKHDFNNKSYWCILNLKYKNNIGLMYETSILLESYKDENLRS